jgi:hypothetical protein
VQCSTPWVPVVENGGHECLIVEAYIPVFDPLTAPMYPWVDRHVGQRNVNLVTLSAGQSLSMSLQAVNIADFAQALTIEVQPVLQKEIPPALADRARTLRTEIKPPSAALPVSLRLSDERSAVTGGAITRHSSNPTKSARSKSVRRCRRTQSREKPSFSGSCSVPATR